MSFSCRREEYEIGGHAIDGVLKVLNLALPLASVQHGARGRAAALAARAARTIAFWAATTRAAATTTARWATMSPTRATTTRSSRGARRPAWAMCSRARATPSIRRSVVRGTAAARAEGHRPHEGTDRRRRRARARARLEAAAGSIHRSRSSPHPGNPGIARARPLRAVSADDVPGIVRWHANEKPDLVVIGPEAPLAAGLADALRARRHPGVRSVARARRASSRRRRSPRR